METQNETEPLKIGTEVKIRNSGYGPARIVEFRGRWAPRAPKSTASASGRSPRLPTSKSWKISLK